MEHNPYQTPPEAPADPPNRRMLVITVVMVMAVLGGVLAAAFAWFVTMVAVLTVANLNGYPQSGSLIFGSFVAGVVAGVLVLIGSLAAVIRLLYKHYDLGNAGN